MDYRRRPAAYRRRTVGFAVYFPCICRGVAQRRRTVGFAVYFRCAGVEPDSTAALWPTPSLGPDFRRATGSCPW
jgi:hypothetical protein